MQELTIWHVMGKDVARFLQGQLTVDVYNGIRCFSYCNIKGRVCTIGWVFEYNDNWYLAIAEENAIAMFKAWQPYAAFSGISTEKSDSFGWSIQNKPGELCWGKSDSWICFADDIKSETNWHYWAIENKLPIITEETQWMYTPHMLGLHLQGAVDFDKGCYLGQEIIARTQHLGTQKRKLITFTNPKTQFKTNDPIFDNNGNEVGKVLFAGLSKSQAVVSIGSDYYLSEQLFCC